MATFTTIVSKPVTFTTTTNVVNLTAHGFNANVAVKFSVITTTTGITVNTFYYVIADTVNTFKLSNTINGTVLPLTTNGNGTLSAVSRSDLATTISATNNIKTTTSFKFLPEIFKFTGIQLSNIISYEYIPRIDRWKKFSGINAIEHATFEFISGQVFKKFSGINAIEHGTFKFLPEIFKFSGIKNMLECISFDWIINTVTFKKFSGSTMMFALSVKNLARIDRWKKFSGVANILEALSIIIPPSREIGTRFTFAGISKLLISLSIIIPPSREIGTRFTFAGLGTIIASTAKISDFPSTLKYSALNVITTSNAFISDFTEDLKFSALNVIATSNAFISDFTTKIAFSGMIVVVSSSIEYIQSEVYAKFSGMNIAKIITTRAKYWKDDILPVIKQLIEFWS